METTSSTPQKYKTTTFPAIPRRGQIKLQILGNLVKAVTSKPGAQGKNRGEGGGGSASTTPSPSAYNSDANSDI
ncbi:hypothetical protein C1H46_039460 [Malus baccata]|uniref:Uncharacterized protein n=1 Tax=Malus baccata TaxID=106549 RepID=A0A540KLU1_MALBA|nr:hypothetical protein C1H46_039460 [Malus baccata]